MRKSGFTLIELLVVVLIIGILTSIAIPQYEKSVARARSAEVMITTKSILDATSIYAATFRVCPGSFSDLDVRVAGVGSATPTVAMGKDWTFTLTSISTRNCAVNVAPRYATDGNFVAQRVLVRDVGEGGAPADVARGQMYWVCSSGDCAEFFLDLGVNKSDSGDYYQ